MRDLVILCGGYGLDTRNASAVRALGLAQMIQSLGFRAIVVGKFQNPPAAARGPDGVEIHEDATSAAAHCTQTGTSAQPKA